MQYYCHIGKNIKDASLVAKQLSNLVSLIEPPQKNVITIVILTSYKHNLLMSMSLFIDDTESHMSRRNHSSTKFNKHNYEHKGELSRWVNAADLYLKNTLFFITLNCLINIECYSIYILHVSVHRKNTLHNISNNNNTHQWLHRNSLRSIQLLFAINICDG
jgi:hypothetical protein